MTYNLLMVIEMLMLCYVARLLYINDGNKKEEESDRNKDKIESVVVTNNNENRYER